MYGYDQGRELSGMWILGRSRTSSKGLELEIHVLIKKVTCGMTVVHCTADNVQDFWSKIKSH